MSNSLETELSAALANDGISAAELNALLLRVGEAIIAAENDAKSYQEQIYELDADPQAANAQYKSKLIAAGRLRTAEGRLQRKLSASEASERLAAWEADFGSMEKQRNELAAELVDAFGQLAKVAEVFSRITVFEGELSKFQSSRPSGAPGHILEVELHARGRDAFDRDHPPLSQLLKLYSLGGKQIWPIPQKRDWVQSIPVLQGTYGEVGPDWWHKEIQEARQAQVKAESDRVTAYYKQQGEARAAREHAEDQEKWKNAGGASK